MIVRWMAAGLTVWVATSVATVMPWARWNNRQAATSQPDTYLGGHDFEQLPEHEDDCDYQYFCVNCGAVVSGWEIEDDMWAGPAGLHCTGRAR